MGVIDQPPDWLLLSDFAVMPAFVHLKTSFMIVPILNTMLRTDKSLVEAARHAGASGPHILWNIVIPLTNPGIITGTILVLPLVMGDFVTGVSCPAYNPPTKRA